jgi:hypothetical protein
MLWRLNMNNTYVIRHKPSGLLHVGGRWDREFVFTSDSRPKVYKNLKSALASAQKVFSWQQKPNNMNHLLKIHGSEANLYLPEEIEVVEMELKEVAVHGIQVNV